MYWEISEEELDMLHTVQQKLTSPPVLALPRWQSTYTGNTKACHWQADANSFKKTWRTQQTHWLLIKIYNRPRGRVWYYSSRMSRCSLGSTTSLTIHWSHLLRFTHGPRGAQSHCNSGGCCWLSPWMVLPVAWKRRSSASSISLQFSIKLQMNNQDYLPPRRTTRILTVPYRLY